MPRVRRTREDREKKARVDNLYQGYGVRLIACCGKGSGDRITPSIANAIQQVAQTLLKDLVDTATQHHTLRTKGMESPPRMRNVLPAMFEDPEAYALLTPVSQDAEIVSTFDAPPISQTVLDSYMLKRSTRRKPKSST